VGGDEPEDEPRKTLLKLAKKISSTSSRSLLAQFSAAERRQSEGFELFVFDGAMEKFFSPLREARIELTINIHH
jgi:hypothetical protein